MTYLGGSPRARRTLRGVSGLLCALGMTSCFDEAPTPDDGSSNAADAAVRSGADAASRDVNPGRTSQHDASAEPSEEPSDETDGGRDAVPGHSDAATSLPRTASVVCDKRWTFTSEELPRVPYTGVPTGVIGPQYGFPIGFTAGQIVASDGLGRVLLTGIYKKSVDLGTGSLPIQDPSAQFSAGGAFVLELDAACAPVWSRGLLAPDPKNDGAGQFVAFSPASDQIRVGVGSNDSPPGALTDVQYSSVVYTLDHTGAVLSKSAVNNAFPRGPNVWAITPQGAVIANEFVLGPASSLFGQPTSRWQNLTFEGNGTVHASAPLQWESEVAKATSEFAISPDGALSWVGQAATPLLIDGQTLTGADQFDFVCALDASGHLTWHKTLRDGIAVGSNDSNFHVARDSHGNTFVLDMFATIPEDGIFRYDLSLQKIDAAGTLLWETRGSTAGPDVIGSWMTVDDAHGHVAFAFIGVDSVQFGTQQVDSHGALLVVQLDASGALAWGRNLVTPDDMIDGWAFNPLGELVIAGSSKSPGSAADYQLFVTKLAP